MSAFCWRGDLVSPSFATVAWGDFPMVNWEGGGDSGCVYKLMNSDDDGGSRDDEGLSDELNQD
jgi:hypothetical protein